MTIIEQLACELNRPAEHIENVVRLLDEGNTIPFIARYRKELHGSMDDTALRTLEERLAYLRNLTERKESVKASIAEQEKLTDELAAAIDAAQTLAEVEDLYRPYKPKRRTRATVAKEKGLEPLAALLFAQERDCPRPEEAAADYLSAEKGVETVADALQGANDIVAEWISDDAAIRRSLRELLEKRGTLRSLAATEEDSVYRLYYDFEQPLSRLQGHQILAINRGEKEKMLSAAVLLDRELALPLLLILYLLHKESHNSGMILLCLIFATMLICTLSPGRWLLLLIPAGVVVGAYFLKGLAGGEGYAAGRMDSTWGLAPLDTAGMLWQTRQSIYAISTGGMFGVGIGASVQKHQWLPYAENDFIFGVIGEELGFFGCVILIGAFAVLLIMGVMIALRAPDLYGTVLGIGIISQIAWQVFLHIAVGTALIPNTGISLPFFSSGGTSLLLLLSEMGVLLSISRAGNAREQRLAEQHRAETERMLQRTRYRSRAAR